MKSFEELCQENYNRIYKYIYAMTGSREAAEDILQDVFTIAFEKGGAFLLHENPPAFLCRAARNLTLTYLKQKQRHPSDSLDDNTADGDMDLSEKLLQARDRQLDETLYANQVINSLSGAQRELYEARYQAHIPIRDIASGQNVSETAMRMRLVRLRREIYTIVKDLKLDEM